MFAEADREQCKGGLQGVFHAMRNACADFVICDFVFACCVCCVVSFLCVFLCVCVCLSLSICVFVYCCVGFFFFFDVYVCVCI